MQRVDEFDSANTFLKHKLLYSFRSPKTHEEHFVHMFNVKKSSYVMLRRSELEANPSMLNELDERFQQLYDYFD